MLTEKITIETSSHLPKVIHTCDKSSFSSASSSTHDIQLHNDVTKSEADICINKTQTLESIHFKERENSESKIERPIANNNYSIYRSDSNNKMHQFVYLISYEHPPMNTLSSNKQHLTPYDSPTNHKSADIQTFLPEICTQSAINSSCMIPYSDHVVNPFINCDFPFVQSTRQLPNHLQQQKYVEDFQNAFLIQSSSSILLRRTNRVFFPLYCGTCKVYGCQCFYPLSDQQEYSSPNQAAQYSCYPNYSIPFQQYAVSNALMEQTKSKQSAERHQNDDAEKSLENSMKQTVQLKEEPNSSRKATYSCHHYYQQQAPAPLPSIIELSHNHRNNTNGSSFKSFYPTFELKNKKHSHFKKDNHNNIQKNSTLNDVNTLKKPKFNKKFDNPSFQEKNKQDFTPTYFPNKPTQYRNGNMKAFLKANNSNQSYLGLNESHLKNREFKYFQPSFLELNKPKQSNDFYQMNNIQLKSTSKSVPLCRLGPDCKFKRQNRCKFDHSKDAEHSETSEKLISSKNVSLYTKKFSLNPSVENFGKLTEYYSIDSYLNNHSLIN